MSMQSVRDLVDVMRTGGRFEPENIYGEMCDPGKNYPLSLFYIKCRENVKTGSKAHAFDSPHDCGDPISQFQKSLQSLLVYLEFVRYGVSDAARAVEKIVCEYGCVANAAMYRKIIGSAV